MTHTINHYKKLRWISHMTNTMRPAHEALAIARNRSDKCYYGASVWDKNQNYIGAISDNGLRWIESLGSAGLRLVGYCDEINKSIDHKGWYTIEDCDETIRGCVFQRQAKNGSPVFLAGYECPNNPETYRIATQPDDWFISNEYEVDPCDHDACVDAARIADQHAQIDAESEREYNETWHRAQQAYGQLKEANDSRRAAIEYVRTACGFRSIKDKAGLLGINPDELESEVVRLIVDAQSAIECSINERQLAWSFIDDHKPTQRWQAHLFSAWQEGFNGC